MKYKTERINVIKNAITERTYSSREVVAEVKVEFEKKYRKESNLETKKRARFVRIVEVGPVCI